MARELHDVLAHTLSALSLQLEALDTLMSASVSSSAELREQLDITKQLVHTGLQDARGTVRALREDVPPLDRQLEKLAAEWGATLQVAGLPRQLGPDVSLALHRAAQEGLTNVVKHAPGASTEIRLAFNDHTVTLSVTNGPPTGPPSPISSTGGGYGVQGIEERLLLVGGRAEGGPIGDGWRLVAEAPV
jgi:signal transduction histidine kinase